ncbi:MAG TPA: hypothetical protein VFH70_07740 [Acidimicrobiales bacterium]|nr:hypothetical protein [Acidimicrobiales bacterium]
MKAAAAADLLHLEIDVQDPAHPGAWLDVFGDAVDFEIERGGSRKGVTDEIETGTLTVTILSAELDPTSSDKIKRGQAVRFMAGDVPLFTGRSSYADVSYPGRKDDPTARPRVVLTAVDLVEQLNNTPAAYNYVGTFADKINALMGGTGFPYVADAPPAATAPEVLSVNDSASLWLQLILARDSFIGSVWVDRDGTLHGTTDPSSRPLWALDTLDPAASFTELQLAYSARGLVNNLTIQRNNRQEESGGRTYGPYVNQPSVDAVGVSSQTVDIIDGTPSTLAHAYLAPAGAPALVPETVALDPAQTAAAQQIDLYDRVTIANYGTADEVLVRNLWPTPYWNDGSPVRWQAAQLGVDLGPGEVYNGRTAAQSTGNASNASIYVTIRNAGTGLAVPADAYCWLTFDVKKSADLDDRLLTYLRDDPNADTFAADYLSIRVNGIDKTDTLSGNVFRDVPAGEWAHVEIKAKVHTGRTITGVYFRGYTADGSAAVASSIQVNHVQATITDASSSTPPSAIDGDLASVDGIAYRWTGAPLDSPSEAYRPGSGQIDPAVEWWVVGINHSGDSDAGWSTVLTLRQPLTADPAIQITVPAAGSETGPVDQLPTPPRPSAPSVSARLGTISVGWDGLAADGTALAGTRWAEVWRTDPDQPDTLIGTIGPAGGVILDTAPVYGTQYAYQLRLIDRDRRPSDYSDPGYGTAVAVVDTDLIGAVVAGANIKDGTINAADKIIGESITGNLIAALTIEAGHLAANSVTADKIEAGAITTAKLAATAIDGMDITGVKIHAGTFYTGSRAVYNDTAMGWLITSDGYCNVNDADGNRFLTINPKDATRYVKIGNDTQYLQFTANTGTLLAVGDFQTDTDNNPRMALTNQAYGGTVQGPAMSWLVIDSGTGANNHGPHLWSNNTGSYDTGGAIMPLVNTGAMIIDTPDIANATDPNNVGYRSQFLVAPRSAMLRTFDPTGPGVSANLEMYDKILLASYVDTMEIRAQEDVRINMYSATAGRAWFELNHGTTGSNWDLSTTEGDGNWWKRFWTDGSGAHIQSFSGGGVLPVWQDWNDDDGSIRFGGILWSADTYNNVLTGGTSMYIGSAGQIFRQASARRYKAAIEDLATTGTEILAVQPREWHDKHASDRYADAMTEAAGDQAKFADLWKKSGMPDPFTLIPGVIAEEVEAAGLGRFVQYGPDGAVEGVMYDRLWLPLIPIIRDLVARVAALEASVTQSVGQ